MAKDNARGEQVLRWWERLNPLAGGLGPAGRILRGAVAAAILYVLCAPLIMWYEYERAFPPFFDPAPPAAQGQAPGQAQGQDPGTVQSAPAKGVVFAGALVTMSERMLGSWLPNDVFYPTALLDNPQNFQLGQLEVVRYATRALRDKLARQRTTDRIDPEADRAFTSFSNNPHAWVFPSAEYKFGDGVKALKKYRVGLEQGTSAFHPRADNLIELLDQFTSLLGGVDTRLANAPREGSLRLSEETAGDPYSKGERMVQAKTPWAQIDDNFYFARGVAYGIRETLAAARWEFREIIKLKRSQELMDSIIDELGLADFEPIFVLNGARDSILANHSLSLMATLEDVRQKMISLQHMLER
jgi:hypothetical protein